MLHVTLQEHAGRMHSASTVPADPDSSTSRHKTRISAVEMHREKSAAHEVILDPSLKT